MLIAPPMSFRWCRRFTGRTSATRGKELDVAELEGKTAIIYGGGGGIGGGVARTFAREGAKVVLVGRTREQLDAVAKDITSGGGSAEVALVDALDEQAVDEHVQAVASKAGSVDVSFNLINRGDVQGTPLSEMTTDDLLRAVVTGLQSSFITARAAARRMVEQGSGVILHLNSASGAAAMPGMGSTGPADAATEALMRYLAAEVGPHGVRVCGIWTAGVAETLSDDKLAAVGGDDAPDARTAVEMIAAMAALRRAPRLADVAEAAAFLASDRAAGMTGSMANVTSGLVLR
jgi:NAD(P)-dependent dehydrogenase (short-subunit alcohol dehydrogenase family)